MDPNTTLKELLEIAHELINGNTTPSPEEFLENGFKMAAGILYLNEWLTKGGSLPKAWERRKL